MTRARVGGNVSSLQEGVPIPALRRSLSRLGGYRPLGLIALGAVTALLSHKAVLHRPLLLGVDLQVYAGYAAHMAEGRLPYRDFPLEYPPLALPAFAFPRLFTPAGPLGADDYARWFVLLMLVLAAIVGLVAARTETRLTGSAPRGSSFLRFAAGSVLLAPVLLRRYDLVPALCTALALLAFLGARDRSSGWWLGLGVAAKLYPAVIVPIFWVERISRRDPKAAGALVQGGLLAVALALLPFALLAPAGLGRTWSYHALRGLQVESAAGGLVLLAARLGWTDVRVEERFGADQLANSWTHTVAVLLPAATALSVVLLAMLAYRRFRQDHVDGRETGPAVIGYTTLALLAFMLTSKVLSPQYLIWTLPLLPLLPVRAAGGLLGAYALTAVQFPWHYWSLVSLAWPAVLLVNARNAALLLVGVMLLRAYRPARG